MTPETGTLAEVEGQIETGAGVAIAIEVDAISDRTTAISTIPIGRHHHEPSAPALTHLTIRQTFLWIDRLLVVPPVLPRGFARIADRIIHDQHHPATGEMPAHVSPWTRVPKALGATTRPSAHRQNAKEPAVHPLGPHDLLSPNANHHSSKTGMDATGAPHPGTAGAAGGVVAPEGALLIGVESAVAKIVVALISHDQVDQDHLSGIENPVYLQTDSIGHSWTTITATEILTIGHGLGLYLGTLHGLQYQKYPHIPHIPERMRVCAQPDLLLWMITVVLPHLCGQCQVSRAANCVVLAAKITCVTLSRCVKRARLMPTTSSDPDNHGYI